MVAISAFAVVPAGQVNAVSTAVALNKAIRALINVCLLTTTKQRKIQTEKIAVFIQGKNDIPGVSRFHRIIFITDT